LYRIDGPAEAGITQSVRGNRGIAKTAARRALMVAVKRAEVRDGNV
jgi:hypothetical protein